MIPDWQPLDAELKLWLDQEVSLPLWWRDDDTICQTPQLDRLSEMSQQLGLPVHLAIVPRDVDPNLADYALRRPTLIPVVHGWAHMNHAPDGEKKSEFGLYRPLEDIVADARAGHAKLTELFGNDLRPMFVPPWNRIAAEAVNRLPEIGFRFLSTATPRKTAQPMPGLDQINTHLDPIDWRGSRGLIPADTLIAQTAGLLRDRREGRADNTEPFGVLTHHLVHDQDIWDFINALLRKLLDGPADAWVAPRT
ncbi:polysaccharide deacetylase family protein [uncultured Ruegeria sp.]|jgi:hypothetical protein|uniref:polysaccharide deacetylase family protein n=1 Tax=uncultured Ruegeria sp. TaxID=259304 RepID=UPI0026146AAD|nr:polysaccharide deacetylase family protein [uncultured Ruegeria sp.]